MNTSIELRGTVQEAMPNARFLCRTDDGRDVICHVGGDMRMKVVRVLPGEGRHPELGIGRKVGHEGPSIRQTYV